MSISLLIPTYRRLALWRDDGRLLRSLYHQTLPGFECVIVDDGSPDGTADWLAAKFAANPPPFTVKVVRVLKPKVRPTSASDVPDNIWTTTKTSGRTL